MGCPFPSERGGKINLGARWGSRKLEGPDYSVSSLFGLSLMGPLSSGAASSCTSQSARLAWPGLPLETGRCRLSGEKEGWRELGGHKVCRRGETWRPGRDRDSPGTGLAWLRGHSCQAGGHTPCPGPAPHFLFEPPPSPVKGGCSGRLTPRDHSLQGNAASESGLAQWGAGEACGWRVPPVSPSPLASPQPAGPVPGAEGLHAVPTRGGLLPGPGAHRCRAAHAHACRGTPRPHGRAGGRGTPSSQA